MQALPKLVLLVLLFPCSCASVTQACIVGVTVSLQLYKCYPGLYCWCYCFTAAVQVLPRLVLLVLLFHCSCASVTQACIVGVTVSLQLCKRYPGVMN